MKTILSLQSCSTCVCVSLSSGVCVEAEALQMKDTLTQMKYLLRSTIRPIEWHRLHTFPYERVGRIVCVCVGGKVGRSQTTCRPQAHFVPALLGEARQTPRQWYACASVTPGLCKRPPLMMKRTRPSVRRGPFLSGRK